MARNVFHGVLDTARNGFEFARFGGFDTGDQRAPFGVAADIGCGHLRHYYPDFGAGIAVLLIPPLLLTAEVYDIAPASSAVSSLRENGLDPWVLDFGRAESEPEGRAQTHTDHIQAVDLAISYVARATGRDVMLAGYSQGGMLAYQAAALRHSADVNSIVTFGCPVDAKMALPLPIPAEMSARFAELLVGSGVVNSLSVPAWLTRNAFKLLAPSKLVQARVAFLMQLHDRESLLARERQRRFIDADGWNTWAGPALGEMLDMFLVHNRLLEGGFTVADRTASLSDINVPILTVMGNSDAIGNPRAVRAIARAAPDADVYEMEVRAGHFGLVVGSAATSTTWPVVARWAQWRIGAAALPEGVSLSASNVAAPGAGRTTSAVNLTAEVGLAFLDVAGQATRTALGIAQSASRQFSHLARLQSITPTTRISLGLMLDEAAGREPEGVCFLFADRSHLHHDVKRRVDNVVKGLLSVGIAAGARVGVLMATRPSGFTTLAALSRIGAVAVMLRPDGDLADEAGLSSISWVVSDPEHAVSSTTLPKVTWCVLGGWSSSRPLPEYVIDLEQIDPDAVTTPPDHVPNPSIGDDVAFVFFKGDGPTLRAVNVSQRRWAMSALGTGATADLRPGDTVYCLTPLHHTSSMLMSVGGAVAAGARFAMATQSDPKSFWNEVRRYGVTHVSYTWASLRPILAAPRCPKEIHNHIKVFMGSGMQGNLRRRVDERFPLARVLEFYASAAGDAILAAGRKPGSLGRPLPTAVQLKLAAFDQESRELVRDAKGFGRKTKTDEVGLLLARAEERAEPGVLRGVFAVEDAWRSTGDLFRRDDDGDMWRWGSVDTLVHTKRGVVSPDAVAEALGSLPGVDLSVAYGVRTDDGDVVIASICLLQDAVLTAAVLKDAMAHLDSIQRADYVQVLDDLPLTVWSRPDPEPLRGRGVPTSAGSSALWRLDNSGRYVAVPAWSVQSDCGR